MMKAIEEYRYLSIFQGLDDHQFERIFCALEYKHLSENEIIFQQGADATHLYILLSGKVAVRYKPYDGPVITIATIIPGWMFGWSAALGKKVYTSSAVSLENSTILNISKDNLHEICKINDDTGIIFLEQLKRNITQRQIQTESEFLDGLSAMTDRIIKGHNNGGPTSKILRTGTNQRPD